MAVDDKTIASFRFGYGRRADGGGAPDNADELLASLRRPDSSEARFVGPDLAKRWALVEAVNAGRRSDRKNGTDSDQKAARRVALAQRFRDFRVSLLRPVISEAGLRERLVAFWSDHFTIEARNLHLSLMIPDFIESAIRPHIAGRFSDMLRAVVTHPAMLFYLDQQTSAGPASPIGKRMKRGLNENLAREILELHTLGVRATYSQEDVRQFAELLTGLTINKDGFAFRPRMAEPGAEVVLGKSYGGRRAQLDDIFLALDDLAARRDTSIHLARKLATHFIAPDPDPALVEQLAGRYRRSGGDLGQMTQALIEHRAAWAPLGAKVRPPMEFVVAALRAMGVDGTTLEELPGRQLRQGIYQPLAAMGQPVMEPGGPDGWPEDPGAWITPTTLTARLEWAEMVAQRLGRRLDPRQLVDRVLGDLASPELRFAVAAAEARHEGVALMLASPEFNRR